MFAGIIMSGCIVQGVLGGCVEVGVVGRFAVGVITCVRKIGLMKSKVIQKVSETNSGFRVGRRIWGGSISVFWGIC